MPSRFEEMEARLAESRQSPAYLMEAAIETAIDQVNGRLAELGWNDADLARKMEISRPRVHAMLRGEQQNFTVRTLAQLAQAMGTGLSISFPPAGFVAVPIYRPSAYKEPGAPSADRKRVKVGSTTLEGPSFVVEGPTSHPGVAA